MLEIHLDNLGLHVVLLDHLYKNKERTQEFKETGNS